MLNREKRSRNISLIFLIRTVRSLDYADDRENKFETDSEE